ncbi:MAG: hypothetical protein CBE14_002415 [Rickettsiales bacterium TMED254]|nr:MAG: hypothetical protein CBE14_002415 [Rickettsiales bacterium TMED254]|tara:strand:- start:3036 stop:3383 length:348 start_codon:yes stop_codon:yes gene_type:complete
MKDGKIVQFIGFRGEEYNSAVKIWGEPDFIHPVNDYRANVEIDWENDIIIFAGKEFPGVKRLYRREYADMKKSKNPVAKAVRTSQYKSRVIPDKKKKIKKGYRKYNESYRLQPNS